MPAKTALVAGTLAAATVAGLSCYWPFSRTPAELRLPGTVEVQEVRLSSRVGGRVKEVLVREGQLLRPGEPLATFEAPELEAQREQVERKRQAAYAALDRTRNGA